VRLTASPARWPSRSLADLRAVAPPSAAAAGARYPRRVDRIAVVGVPSSAASYAAGQDLAPMALRSVGLLDELAAAGREVHDDGDLPHQVWKPD